MRKPLISIIIPVYNVEKYLDYCMQSVFKQSYKKLEIILIDDGSTDSSGEMCDEFTMKDSRVNVIHKKNGGLSSARNAGMKKMTGEFYTFIDSDDYIRFDYIEKLYQYLKKDHSDIVIGSFKKTLKEDDFTHVSKDVSKHFKFNREEIKFKILSRQVPMYAHGKLYRAELALISEFPEGRLYEDVPTSWNIVKNINQVTYITDKLYFYRQHLDSIVNAKYRTERMDQVYFTEQILEEIPKSSSIYYVAISRCFFAAADNYSLVTKDFSDDEKYLKEAIIKYRQGVLKDFSSGKMLKIMAVAAYISPWLVKIMGKAYKRYNYYKWKMRNDR